VISTGLRLEGGVLADGASPANHLDDPGIGAWGGAMLALRARPLASLFGDGRRTTGPYLEVDAGGALTGSRVQPTFEGSIGWGIPVGDFVLVPSVGVTHIFSWDDPLGGVGALIGRASLGIVFGDPPPPPVSIEEPVVEAPPPPPPEDPCVTDPASCAPPPPISDRDHDGFPDDQDACPDEAEIINGVLDDDGCPDEGVVELHGDRVVLDDRVLFDFDRARVVRAAMPLLRAVVTMFEVHPEWDRVRVEGHADERGDEDFNVELSERRANAVRNVLIGMGMPADRIEVAGLGESRLLDLGTTEEAHARNRRVELVMIDDDGRVTRSSDEGGSR